MREEIYWACSPGSSHMLPERLESTTLGPGLAFDRIPSSSRGRRQFHDSWSTLAKSNGVASAPLDGESREEAHTVSIRGARNIAKHVPVAKATQVTLTMLSNY